MDFVRGKKALSGALLLAATTLPAGVAHAITVDFYCITSNDTSGSACTTGESQFSVDVSDAGGGQVDFTFYNAVGNSSSITDVYFDDGTLLGIATITSSGGVSFAQGATPGNLPSGNTASPPFQATVGFTADSNPPVFPNGVNTAAEYLTITFDLQAGGTFDDVMAELTDGSLRIGIHGQGFDGDFSESFVNNPVVPVPAAVWLFGSGLLGLIGVARTRRRK